MSRRLAENVCRCHAQTIVDEAGGVTLSGNQLADRYAKKWEYKHFDCEQAIRHWVVAAGYNEDGVFMVEYSNYRL